ncbi:MAG: hypothetical protein OXI12_11300 [Gammaproteobacteria bacterium]|nr:hypothetical protein [Gammaproteobacteria bacterium]
MGTNGSRGHLHNGSGTADWAVCDTEELEGSVLVQDPAGPELPPSVIAPDGWMAAWANRFDPAAPDAGEDLAVAWDPERVAQVAMTLEPVTAAEETALAETGWQRLRVDSHEVWARTPEAAQLEIESRRRHPSSRSMGIGL